MRQRGLTLIELLIAISLMAFLSLLGWRGLDTMLRSKDTTQQYSQYISRVQTSLAQWRWDLNAMQVVGGINDAGLAWDGRVLRMIRRTSVQTSNAQEAGLCVVAWTLRINASTGKGEWVRWQSQPMNDIASLQQAWNIATQWGQGAQTNTSNETVLIPIDEWQIYYLRSNAWSNPLSSADPTSSGSGSISPPDAVRLSIDLPSAALLHGRLTLDWSRPNFSNTKS